MSDEDEPNQFAMRSRVARTSSFDDRKNNGVTRDTVVIERKLKPGDTLNKLAIQYAVNVADIKRANNLVNEIDFAVLTSVKIPVSKLRVALGMHAQSSSEEDEHIIDFNERARLIDGEDRSRDPSVEDIFHKTDSSIALARTALPDSELPGSFHFVDARPPSSGFPVWMLLGAVIFVFMIIPLVLTIYEENHPEHPHQTHHPDHQVQ